MTDSPPPTADVVETSASLAYATTPSRSHTWRLVAGVASLVVGCGGILATILATWSARLWTTTPSQIAIAMTNYSVEFLGQLAVALFGLAVLRRSPRAWHAAVAYFSVQMINPLAAAVVFPFVASGMRASGASPDSYWLISGYLSAAAHGLPPLLVLVLLTRPAVHEMIEQWSRGDGVTARS